MLGANKGQPIAVVDKYGCVMPFTTNGVDAVHCLKLGVTYIYTEAELKKILANNEKLHAVHDFENPKMFTQANPKLRILQPAVDRKRESRIEIINPETYTIEG